MNRVDFSFLTRGIGKPDYSREVSSARQRSGIYIKYQQQLVVFAITFTDQVVHPYAIPWVQPPLASGASAHLIELSTGVAMPYATLVGYSITMVQENWTFSEDIEIWLYMDTLLVACPAILPGGYHHYWNPVYAYSSAVFDPEALLPHTWDIIIINNGAGDLEGGFTFATLLEAVGTASLPDTKQCQCPFCHHTQVVKVGTTTIICGACGKTYYVQDFSHVRQI